MIEAIWYGRLILAIPLAIFSVWGIAFNYGVMVMEFILKKDRVPSLIFIAASLAGCMALGLAPFPQLHKLMWLPWAIDPATWVMVTIPPMGLKEMIQRKFRDK